MNATTDDLPRYGLDDFDRAREKVARRLMGFREDSVGKDARGENAGPILVPPNYNSWKDSFQYNPLGPIHFLLHVPHFYRDAGSMIELIRLLVRRHIHVTFWHDFVCVQKVGRAHLFIVEYTQVKGSEPAAVLMATEQLLDRYHDNDIAFVPEHLLGLVSATAKRGEDADER